MHVCVIGCTSECVHVWVSVCMSVAYMCDCNGVYDCL